MLKFLQPEITRQSFYSLLVIGLHPTWSLYAHATCRELNKSIAFFRAKKRGRRREGDGNACMMLQKSAVCSVCKTPRWFCEGSPNADSTRRVLSLKDSITRNYISQCKVYYFGLYGLLVYLTFILDLRENFESK